MTRCFLVSEGVSRRWWSATSAEENSWENCEFTSKLFSPLCFYYHPTLCYKNRLLMSLIWLTGRQFKKHLIHGVFFFFARRLVATLTLLSKKLQCYKITLECAQKNVEFYKKLGYTPSEETYMQCRFFDWVLQGRYGAYGSRRPSSRWPDARFTLLLRQFPLNNEQRLIKKTKQTKKQTKTPNL